MKKLTKSKREKVRFLLKRALNDLKVAKDYTFKAYGSSETTFDIKFAIGNLESALSNLPKTKLPKKTDASPSDRPKDCPAKDKECPMLQNTTKKTEKDDIEKRFQECVCDHLNVVPEQCVPQAKFVEDLGADDLDPVELAMDLEVEFGICFSDDEVSNMSTYEKLLNLVKEKLEAKEKDTKGDGNTEPKAES